MFCSNRWVAKLRRKVCKETLRSIPATSAAAWQARLSWRVVIGCMGLRPGNSQPCGRAARHQARIEQARHLLWTEHHRQLARLANECRVLDDVVALERDPEEEPQRGHRVIENGRLCATLRKMKLKASNIFEARRVWRAAEEYSKVLDRTDVALL